MRSLQIRQDVYEKYSLSMVIFILFFFVWMKVNYNLAFLTNLQKYFDVKDKTDLYQVMYDNSCM